MTSSAALLSYGFDKTKRLLTPAQFKHVFDNPIKKIHSTHFLLFVANNHSEQSRLGLAITKKKVKNATDRNLIKRITRQIFRHHQHTIGDFDVVLIVKMRLPHDIEHDKIAKKQLIHDELAMIFAKLQKLKQD